jgi:hypothetical protein
MKTLSFISLCIICAQTALAQDNFEGEITYKTFTWSSLKKDTIFGDSYKVLFGASAIKIRVFTVKGALYQERLIFFDSLKEIIINPLDKTYRKDWDANSKTYPDVLPWGMDHVDIQPNSKKIAGYNTHLIRLTNDKNIRDGHIDLYTEKGLNFRLPFRVSKRLFMQDLLFFDNHIMLNIQIVAGESPFGRLEYLATDVVTKKNSAPEFEVPPDYTFIK